MASRIANGEGRTIIARLTETYPDWSPHTLRHSCGYYLAERGTEFRTMQDYMGHKNPRHTAHYTRISGRKFVGLFK